MLFPKASLVLALASVMFVRSTSVLAQPACVEVFGLLNCPLGQANLDVIDGNLVVSNIGASGEDGVSVVVPRVELAGFDYAITGTWPPSGATLVMSGIGVINGVPEQPTGQIIFDLGKDDEMITPDFAAIGASTYTLQIFDHNKLIYEEPGRSGPAVSTTIKRREVCCFIFWYYVEQSETTAYQVVGGPLVFGTQARFVPENPTGQAQGGTRLELRGADISEFTIFNEFTTPLPACPADLTGDGVVDAADLAQLLGAWGLNPGNPADFNGDDVVDAADLAQLLGAWGPCE